MPAPTRPNAVDGGVSVLILSAAIGEGHDLPARVLAKDIRERSPGAVVEVIDSLMLLRPRLRTLALAGARADGVVGELLFDLNHWLIARFAPTRALTSRLIEAAAARRLEALIASRRPDVVVATYPGASEVLGRLRRAGRIEVPAASAITDLASLDYWAHPGLDLHMITHPESRAEVESIAPGSRIVAVRGLNHPDFLEPRGHEEPRARLDLPLGATVVAVSGGGWAMGDLAGATDTALTLENVIAVVLTGRSEEARVRLERRFAADDRVRVLGFTDQMADLLAAADVLVHSTAGLTVLEAHCLGCPVISYGWGRGHIRANNHAFERFGLARVVTGRAALARALAEETAARGEPDPAFAALPHAASLVLALAGAPAAAAQQGAHGA